MNSDRIYIVDTSDERYPKHYKTIEPEELHELGLSAPHTSHCIPTGEVMISTMGDGPAGNAQGQFVMLDGKNNFTVKGVCVFMFSNITSASDTLILLLQEHIRIITRHSVMISGTNHTLT